MSTDKKNNWVVWLIVGMCALSVPAGLFAQQARNATKGSDLPSWELKTKDRIAVVNLTGMIQDRDEESILSLSGTTQSALKKVRKLTKDDKIKGLLLRINSPGGTVAASQEIHQALKELRAKKPLVVSMGDIAASGGYYISCTADKIYANYGTLTGSIGVIIRNVNVKGLADKLGVEPKVVKTGDMKDMSSPYLPYTEEQRKVAESVIFDSYEKFVADVAQGRKMKVDDVKKLADGRVYTGHQAKANGLIDELGSYEDAVAGLQALCKQKYSLSEDLPIDDKSDGSFFTALLESSVKILDRNSRPSGGLLADLLPESMEPRFYNQPLWVLE
jgi:signal peptide peptidase SppA, 36K type